MQLDYNLDCTGSHNLITIIFFINTILFQIVKHNLKWQCTGQNYITFDLKCVQQMKQEIRCPHAEFLWVMYSFHMGINFYI